jgi:hypothetical protein
VKPRDLIALVVIAAFVGSIIGGLAWNTERCRDREWKRVQEYGDCNTIKPNDIATTYIGSGTITEIYPKKCCCKCDCGEEAQNIEKGNKESK